MFLLVYVTYSTSAAASDDARIVIVVHQRKKEEDIRLDRQLSSNVKAKVSRHTYATHYLVRNSY